MVAPTTEDQLAFVLTCLSSALDGGAKINFDNVAKAHNTNKSAAYYRLWSLRKKAGFIAASNPPVQDNDGAAIKPGRKRGRPASQGKGRKSKKHTKEVGEAEAVGEEEGDDVEDWEKKKEDWEQKDFGGSVKVEEDSGE